MAKGTSIGAMFVELGLKDTDFSKGLKAAEKSLTSFGNSAQNMRKFLDKHIIRGFAAATASVTAFVAASSHVGAEFQQQLQVVGAISGATGQEFLDLEAKARQLGSTTAFTATEAAVAMQDFARAGLTVNQIIGASGPAMLLAGSAGADMAQATNLLASTLTQFNMNAGQSTRISDVFSTALRKTLFDMSSLTEAMKYAGTIGASFEMTLEETTAAVAMFRNLGLEGSLAGTNFRMAMSAAAKPTEKAQQVLAKYNLTAADVNPALNSFAEIMKTVGSVSMTTSDSLEIFGLRAGANVATIAREFEAGTTNFHQLLESLEDSAGSTQELYKQMGDTVQFQGKIALSALQELMLQSFDTFKAPLQALLSELGSLIQFTGQLFGRESRTISGNMESMLGGVTEWLKQNREILAFTFVEFATNINTAVQALTTMVPVLVKLAGLMTLVWVADRVRLFVLAVQTAITSVGALTGGVRALTAALVASTGGLYALIAAVGTIVAGLALYVGSMNEAEAAAQRLREAEQQLQEDREERAAAQEEHAQQLTEGMNVRLGIIAQELMANDQLSDSLEQQLVALQSLNAEQVRAGLASGQLFEATLAGEKVILDHTAALDLQYEGTVLAEDAVRSYDATLRSVNSQQESNSDKLGTLNKALDEYNKAIDSGVRESTAFMGTLQQYGGTVESVKTKIVSLEEESASLKAQEQGLAEQREVAMQDLQRREVRAQVAARVNEDAQRGAAKATREREQAERDLAEAIKARLESVAEILDQMQLIGADDELKVILEFEKRLDALQQVFAEEIAARQAMGLETASLVSEQAQAEAALYRLFQAERLEEQRQKELEAAKRLEEHLTSLREQELRRRATASQTIELDRLAALKEAEGASAADIAQINAIFDRRRADHRKEISQQVQQLIAAESEELKALQAKADDAILDSRRRRFEREAELLRSREEIEAELADALVQFVDASIEERFAIRQHYNQKLAELDEDAQEAARRRARETLADIGQAAITAGQTVAQGIANIVSEVAGVLQSITGFSFSLLDAVSSVTGEMEDVADLQAQLAAGEISQAEFDESMAELPETAQHAAQEFVQELLEGVLLSVQTFALAAPALVEQLALAIPQIVEELKQSLPAAFEALAGQLPGLVRALSDAVVELVEFAAAQLPLIIDALLAQVPTVVTAIARAVPILLQALADGIAQILAALPSVLELLLEQIPLLVQELVNALDVVVVALVEAIPQLVAVIVEQLPSIVMALVRGVVDLLDVLISEVLGELIPALIEMLPEIISALLRSAVLLVQAVVDALPTLIEGLLVALGEVLSAVMLMLPDLIVAVAELLPEIVEALVSLLPAIIVGLVEGLPQLVAAIIQAIPQMVVALVTEAIPALIMAIPEVIFALVTGLVNELPTLVAEFWQALASGIKDFATKLWDAFTGEGIAGFFGDTPGMQRMRSSGGMIGFAPGDYFIAAQRPEALLQQALQGVSVTGGEIALPGLQGMSQALLQVATAIQAGGTTATAGGNLQVTLRADGQVLDSVLFKAGRRGMTPHLERRARRSTVQAGVHPGFSRGDFSNG